MEEQLTIQELYEICCAIIDSFILEGIQFDTPDLKEMIDAEYEGKYTSGDLLKAMVSAYTDTINNLMMAVEVEAADPEGYIH